MATTIVSTLLAAVACAQQADDTAALLDAARTALAGVEPLRSVYIESEGVYDRAAEHQGMSPDAPMPSPITERFYVNFETGQSAWEQRTLRADGSVRWRRWIGLAPGRLNIVDLTDGFAGAREGESLIDDRNRRLRRYPAFLLATLTADDLDSAAHNAIVARFDDRHTATLTLDPDTSDLTSVSQTVDIPSLGDTALTWRYDDFEPVESAGRFPMRTRFLIGDRALIDMRVTTIAVNEDAGRDLLEVPDHINEPTTVHAVGTPGPPRPPAVEEVAPGVLYITHIRPGLHVMAVEFDDFLVALEAPADYFPTEEIPAITATQGATSDSVAEDFIALLKARYPDKPIRYVAVSHFHYDHAGGVRPFIADGATVLATEADRAFYEFVAAAPHTIANDRLQREPAPLNLEFVDGRRVITDGRRTLELRQVENNPHAEGLLVAWLPEERIMFAPDMFYPAPLTHFPQPNRIPVMRFFVQWLDDHNIAPDRIFGPHAPIVGTPEHLDAIRGLAD